MLKFIQRIISHFSQCHLKLNNAELIDIQASFVIAKIEFIFIEFFDKLIKMTCFVGFFVHLVHFFFRVKIQASYSTVTEDLNDETEKERKVIRLTI